LKISIKVTSGCLALLLTSTSFSQTIGPFANDAEKTIFSSVLGVERKIYVHVPSQGADSSSARYPVIYLLDGDANFRDVVTMTEFMSNAGVCPPMIVVGILHPSRMTDLTFGTDRETPGVIGKGVEFMSYMEKELMPFIEKNYHTAPYRIFLGHSVGGLTVMNTLIHQPELFNAYVSLDGALWWNDQEIVREAKAMQEGKSLKGRTAYMALANRLEEGMDTMSVQKDTTEGTELLRSNIAFIRQLKRLSSNDFRFSHKFYERDDHGSVRFAGEYDALIFIFDYYKLKLYNRQLVNPTFPLDSLLKAHYALVSQRIGYVIAPDENQVNGLAYFAMRDKQFTKAEALFKLNASNYPLSANCFDGLGDLCEAKGNNAEAIRNYKKALAIKPMPETKEKLEKLLKTK
jgi:uncharacterized protein